ncbi:MAG: aromatic acid exporter family protein [Candidatus Nanopelagicaceae bacterium]|nr:aromatic acid exporter family protein [Candidatus Nanopelagicaceae bacterium]
MESIWQRAIAPFAKRKYWIQWILVTASAAAVSWLVGNQVIENGGLVAAIVATLTVRISVNKSLREGFGQLLGTAIGVGTAFISLHFFGFGVTTVFVTVILSLVASRALHLGEVASINVPITALIVLGPGLAETKAIHRTLSTVVGMCIAVVFSYFAHPKSPAGRTIDRIRTLANRSADLLELMSEAVFFGYTQDIAGKMLGAARVLVEEIPTVRSQALEARSYARWFPMAREDEAEELYERGVAIEHSVVQVRTIARTLFDISLNKDLPPNITEKISHALSSAGLAIRRESASLGEEISELTHNSHTNDLRAALKSLAEEFMERGQKIHIAQFARGISLVTNLERIADSLDLDSPAITDVLSPEEAAEMQILARSPMEQGRKIRRKVRRIVSRKFRKSL